MLSSISIRNFALLRDVSVDFSNGLNILTGETGAGKSIIIGALNIAVGERGYTENIRTGEDKSTIEAVFDISGSPKLNEAIRKTLEEAGIEHDSGRIIIKREISRTNKGRIFINNSAASLNTLQAAGKMLVDIHGQHEHQSLLKSDVHIELLDGYSAAEGLLEKVKSAHTSLSVIDAELKKLKAEEAEKSEKLDMIDYRLNEMEAASLGDEGELERLNSERDRLIHAEAIREHAAAAVTALSPGAIDLEGKGAVEHLNAVKKAAEHIIKYDAKPAEALKMVEEAAIKAAEAKAYFLDYLSSLESDPVKLRQTEERIELLEDLVKKYRKKNLADVISYYSELAREKKSIEMNGEIIAVKEKERAAAAANASVLCVELSDLRKKKALELSKKIESELKDLGIGKASFKISLEQKEAEEGRQFIEAKGRKYLFTPQGIDTAEFMISLNPGEDLKPLVKIASGGEVSRIMLAIKNILSEADITDVLVFDEIDTGISGKVAQTVGAKLLEISRKKQLICITHLPQIAACSQKHFSVEKSVKEGKTETTIMPKTGQEKEIEVARLLSGENVSDASLSAARELIKSIPAGS